MASKLQQHVVGAVLRFPVATVDAQGTPGTLDLTGATAPTVRFADPDGTVFERVGTVEDPASSGVVRYVTQAGDLAKLGNYRVQLFLDLPGGPMPTAVLSFRVEASIPAPSP